MGEYADYYIEQEIERMTNGPFHPHSSYRDPYDQLHPFIKQMHDRKTWETKDRTVLKIKDMGTGHILNCMRMMERNAPWYKKYFETYLNQMWLYDRTNEFYQTMRKVKYELQRLQTETPLAWGRTLPLYQALHDEYSSRIKRSKSLVDAVKTREMCGPMKSILKKLKLK